MKPLVHVVLAPVVGLAVLGTPVPADEVVVHDLAGLRAAVSSNRTVVLEPGDYVSDHRLDVSWVKNLVLRGRDRTGTRILSRDDYSDVLHFDHVEGLRLENLTVGHHPDIAYCVGGVVTLSRTKDVVLEGVTLFGSGVEGLSVLDSERVTLAGSEIRECTSSALSVVSSRDVVARDSVFRDSEIWEGIVNVHGSDLRLESVGIEFHGEERVDLFKLQHIPYYLAQEDFEPLEGGESRVRMVGGSVSGRISLDLPDADGVVLDGVDTSGVEAGEVGPPEGEPAEPDAPEPVLPPGEGEGACGCEAVHALAARVADLEREKQDLVASLVALQVRVQALEARASGH